MENYDDVIGKKVPGLGVGVAIFNERKQVLLMQRGALRTEENPNGVRNEPHKWDLPGGGVDFGETLEDAIKREVLEELQIQLMSVHHLPCPPLQHFPDGQHWVSHTYGAVQALASQVPMPPPSERFKIVALQWAHEHVVESLVKNGEATMSLEMNLPYLWLTK